MQNVFVRVVYFALTLALAMIPSAWSGWGVVFDGVALRLDLDQLLSNAIIWGVGAFGLAGAAFALWGTGGRAAVQRVVLYVLSPLPPLVAAIGAGWGVTIEDAVLVIQIEAFAAALVAGSGISIGILQRWGVR